MSYTNYRNLKGLPEAIAEFDKIIHIVKKRCLSGLIKAQARIYEHMETVPPRIPVKTGNLRESYFAVTSNGAIIRGGKAVFGDENKDKAKMVEEHKAMLEYAKAIAVMSGEVSGPSIVLGFSSYYAEAVHENYGVQYHRPLSGAGFFAAAVKANRNYILHVIAEKVWEGRTYKG